MRQNRTRSLLRKDCRKVNAAIMRKTILERISIIQ